MGFKVTQSERAQELLDEFEPMPPFVEEAFNAYLESPPPRSVTDFSKAHTKWKLRTLRTWSAKYQWISRANAYDDRVIDANSIVMQRVRNRKVLEFEELLLRRAEEDYMTATDGLRTLHKEGRINAQGYVQWAALAFKLMMRALRQPEEIRRVEATGPGGGPIALDGSGGITDEQFLTIFAAAGAGGGPGTGGAGPDLQTVGPPGQGGDPSPRLRARTVLGQVESAALLGVARRALPAGDPSGVPGEQT